MDVKSVEISNKLGQSLPGLQIYLNFAENIKSEFLAGRSHRISGKVNDYKLNDFCKCFLQKVPAYNVKSIAFCCGAIYIPGFDPREAANMALAVKLWLESNYSSVDCVIFFRFENANYEIYKDLMSAVYFCVSKYHLTDI